MGGMKDMIGDSPYDLFSRPVLDQAVSDAGRAAGTEAVSEHNAEWMAAYLEFVTKLPTGWIGTAEMIRAVAPVRAPDHPNAWGAACLAAVRKGLLHKTGNYVPMHAAKSHSRATPEYMRT